MKTLIVVSHPTLDQSQTQQFLKASAATIADATWHHLDASLPFDPAQEQALLRAADRIIFQFPLYWYAAPASLYQWLDEVWVRSAVYDAHGGLLTGKSLGLVVNLGQPARGYQLGGAEGVSLSELFSPFAALARKTGLRMLAPLVIDQFSYQDEAAHQKLLVAYQQYLTLAHPDKLSEQADWWLDQLADLGDQAALVGQTLATGQETLVHLQETINELKEGEED